MTEEEFNKIFSEARHYACKINSVLKAEYEKLSEDTKEYLEDITEVNNQMIDLIIAKLAMDRALLKIDEADEN